MLSLVLILLVLLAINAIQVFTYWKRRGVETVNLIYSFNNYSPSIIRQHPSGNVFNSIYKRYYGKRYVGFYNLANPVLLVFDSSLIKTILTADFRIFSDRNQDLSIDNDKIWSRVISFLPYARGWRDIRTSITPFFNAIKIKSMVPLMQTSSARFMKHIESTDRTSASLNDAIVRYAHDVVTNAAFGITLNSFDNMNNEYWLAGKRIAAITSFHVPMLLVYLCSPFILKLLNVKILPDSIASLLKKHVQDTIRLREEHNIVRPDIIQLLHNTRKKLLENKNNSKASTAPNILEITDDIITSQIVALMFAGTNTSSLMLRFVFYELANNLIIQEKAYLEIMDKINGSITYEKLVLLKYLDNVILECCRMHPGTLLLERVNVKPHCIKAERPGENDVFLPKNSIIWIPLHPLHMDSKYYPNPETFDPDRFTKGIKISSNPNFLTFGIGPRKCLGEKLGIMEMKVILVNVIQTYKILPTKNSVKLSNYDYEPNFCIELKSRT